MKTYKDVIEETVEYYKTHPFGYTGSNCVYFGDNGEMCAVGRCLNEPELLKGIDMNGDLVIELNKGGGLKDEYKHLKNPIFWHDLQRYHDTLARGARLTAESELQDMYNTLEKNGY